MKPTNNKVYCIGGRRSKILFESQSKADNFIKYNRVEIKGHSEHSPSRSYYCTFCCGWHVTSIHDEAIGKICDINDQQLWEEIRIKCLMIDIENACVEIEALIDYADYAGAQLLMENTRLSFWDVKHRAQEKNIAEKFIQFLEARLDNLFHKIVSEGYSYFMPNSQNHCKE